MTPAASFAAIALSLASGLALAPGLAGAAPAPLDLSGFRAPAPEDGLRAAGLARTSVERSSPDGRSSAAFGFLCGRQAAATASGGAAAYGVDPHGRFIGAQLKLRFR